MTVIKRSKLIEYVGFENDFGDIVVQIFYITKIETKLSIRYYLTNKYILKFNKDGVGYKVFRSELNNIVSKPLSFALRSMNIDGCGVYG